MPGSLSESLTDDPLVIAGPKYKNVTHPSNCIIAFIYSKSSIGFLCLIGCLTTISTYLFTTQYCRMLEFSVPVNIVQLLLCLAALFFALNRRSRFFFTCYVLLGLSLLFGTIFLVFLSLLNYEQFIVPSVHKVLHSVIKEDHAFCQVLEPLLACQLNENGVDLIERTCQQPRRHMYLASDCVQHLTSFLTQKNWLLALVVQYGILLLLGVGIIMRSAYKFRQKRLRNKQSSRVIVVDSGGCIDHQDIGLHNGAQL